MGYNSKCYCPLISFLGQRSVLRCDIVTGAMGSNDPLQCEIFPPHPSPMLGEKLLSI